jgi:hypothetical protein
MENNKESSPNRTFESLVNAIFSLKFLCLRTCSLVRTIFSMFCLRLKIVCHARVLFALTRNNRVLQMLCLFLLVNERFSYQPTITNIGIILFLIFSKIASDDRPNGKAGYLYTHNGSQGEKYSLGNLSTCSAPQHLFSTSTPQHLSIFLGAGCQHLPPWNKSKRFDLFFTKIRTFSDVKYWYSVNSHSSEEFYIIDFSFVNQDAICPLSYVCISISDRWTYITYHWRWMKRNDKERQEQCIDYINNSLMRCET